MLTLFQRRHDVLELRHFSVPVGADNLIALIRDTSQAPTESYERQVDFSTVSDLASTQIEGDSGRVSVWDGELGPLVHQALKALPRRMLLDPALWDWLAITQLRDWVLRRWWQGTVPQEGPLKVSKAERFLARPTLHGFAHHAVARLYWGADALYAPDAGDGGYEHFKTVFAAQDFQQNLFERKLSLWDPVPTVCAVALKPLKERPRREKLKRLNYLASTIALEALDADGVRALLAMDLARYFTSS
jgi:hypothetical protein